MFQLPARWRSDGLQWEGALHRLVCPRIERGLRSARGSAIGRYRRSQARESGDCFHGSVWPGLWERSDRNGREPVVAFFESCRWIGALPGADTNDWFRRRSIFILTLANSR